jgi:hypothetical protein
MSQRAAAVGFDQLVDARLDLLLNVAAQHRCPLAREKACGRAADAAVSAGNNRDSSLKPAEPCA